MKALIADNYSTVQAVWRSRTVGKRRATGGMSTARGESVPRQAVHLSTETRLLGWNNTRNVSREGRCDANRLTTRMTQPTSSRVGHPEPPWWHSSVVSWPALPHVSHASVAQFHNIWHSYRRHSLIHYTGDRLVRSREAKEPSFIPPSHP